MQVLKWSDYCLPLACSPGQPFRAVAQASIDNFSRLGVAFIEDRLQLDNGLLPSKIIRTLPSINLRIFLYYILLYFHITASEHLKLCVHLSLWNAHFIELVMHYVLFCEVNDVKLSVHQQM